MSTTGGVNSLHLVPADYPSNQQFASHFGEFLAFGYKPSMGCVDVRFNHGCGDRILKLHDVKFVDGQTKVLICLAIIGFCSELEFSETQLEDPQLKMVLQSLTSIRCTYHHFDNESDHFLHSLRSSTIFRFFQKKRLNKPLPPSLWFFICQQLSKNWAMLPPRNKHQALSISRQIWGLQWKWRESHQL